MRIRLQRHIRTKTHKKRSATVSPYVGIIQIRFRQYRIILSADTASEARQLLSKKRR